MSRASLLAGRLTTGEQGTERKDYEALTRSSGKIRASLFHKKDVDTRIPGWAISDDVGRAISDHDLPLVTVVLNTIDDALDRSDPAGTTWTADAVKHLEPLLTRARAAGRTVIMTADHGHIVERRGGTQRSYPGADSGRSRPAGGDVEAAPNHAYLNARHIAFLDLDRLYFELERFKGKRRSDHTAGTWR